MTAAEAGEISQLLSGATGSASPCQVFVDTFRHPYIQFPERFVLPGSTITGITRDESRRIVTLLAEKIPWIVSGCQILPEARPRKDSGQLHLVRPLVWESRNYMFVFKLSAPYMGGASADEILGPAQQGISPAIQTDRIYFNARLLPVHTIQRSGHQIVDFQPVQIREAIFEVTSKTTGRDVWSTVLFDEVDFSEVNQTFSQMFSRGTDWTGGRLFSPVLVDYLTLAMNLLWCEKAFVDGLLGFFDRAFTTFLSGGGLDALAAADQTFWREYFAAWAFERRSSRGGNPHWQLVKHPDAEWLARVRRAFS